MKKNRDNKIKNRIDKGKRASDKNPTSERCGKIWCIKASLGGVRHFVNKLPARGKRLYKDLASMAKRLFETYKHWLYNDAVQKVTPYVKTECGRFAAAIVAVFLFLTFGLYYMGVYDLGFTYAFDERMDNRDTLLALFSVKDEEGSSTPADTEETDNTDQSVTSQLSTVSSVDISNTLKKKDNTSKINTETVFATSEELEAQGYYLTDATYDENTCEVGLMSFSYSLPTDFSYGSMSKRTWQITEYDDGRVSTVEDTEETVERPAIYLYMGYIIYDDSGRALYLADSRGTLLMSYDDSYIPAMARDTSGNPLFYKNYSYYADAPVAYEVNEVGEEIVTETKGVTLTGKNYFSLSASGTYFVSNDYVEERDGRGLNFDFPSSYGLADGQIVRVGIMSPKVTTFLNGKSALVNFMSWNYFLKNDPAIPVLDDIIARESSYSQLTIEEKLKATEEKTTPSDVYNVEEMLPYSYAYNYNGGYATVVTDETGEEEKYETTELRVINTYGEMMFASKKKYYNSSFKNYCSDRYLLPLSKGEDSVGHLYFDHGLLRLRKVCYDNYQLEEYGDFRVNSDEDILVYPSGKEFPIPSGYTLCGYSDGILVLERGGLYGYMNYMGKWIADPQYTNAEAFHGGIGVVTDTSGKVCALNTNGDYVLPLKYDYIQNRSDGLIAAYSADEGWQIYGIFTK